MKVLGSIWFTEMGNYKPIGIVVVDTGFERKAYIGNGTGVSQMADEKTILERGAKFPLEMAETLCGVPSESAGKVFMDTQKSSKLQ